MTLNGSTTPPAWMAMTPPLRVDLADRFFSRLSGLLARDELRKGEALLLVPCNGVHTFFMTYHIDIVFLGCKGRVLKVVTELAPWRIASCKGACSVLEMRGGEAACYGIKPGMTLDQVTRTQAAS